MALTSDVERELVWGCPRAALDSRVSLDSAFWFCNTALDKLCAEGFLPLVKTLPQCLETD